MSTTMSPMIFYFIIICTTFSGFAMDFNDGMKNIRSYQDLCQMHKEADVSYGKAVVAYRVDRRSRFYCRCNPVLDAQDQKLMSSGEHACPRVHYALIEESTYEDLPPSSFSYTYFEFVPILIKGKPIPQLEIVDCPEIAKRHDKCFIFSDEWNYFDKTEFCSDAGYFPIRKQINILRTRDNLRMRPIHTIDALILLQWLQTQKISVGWQDESLAITLKKKFEQEYGFSYDSRGTIKQKLC